MQQTLPTKQVHENKCAELENLMLQKFFLYKIFTSFS
jgi:hypothetical protein